MPQNWHLLYKSHQLQLYTESSPPAWTIRCAPLLSSLHCRVLEGSILKIGGCESSSGDKVHATQTSLAHTSTARLEKWRQEDSWGKLAIQCSKNGAFQVQWETWPRQRKWRMIEEDACVVLWSGCMQGQTLKSFLACNLMGTH